MTKILYSVQGTGNGHISRARVLGPKLLAAGFDVQFLFSGRKPDEYFDMKQFGDYLIRQGLTFQVREGNILYLQTLLHSSPVKFITEARSLDLSQYDMVITDFEPVTAWAARQQKVRTIGIGHQYAFDYAIPKGGDNRFTRTLMREFAPATTGIGLHWHHFGQPILPPIIEVPPVPEQLDEQKILVYLPFEKISAITELLKDFRFHRFHVFHPYLDDTPVPEHILIHKVSRPKFQQEFADCFGIITNSGFELASESLQAGKKILVKPLKGQFEQESNAIALQQLGLGTVMESLDANAVAQWLKQGSGAHVQYPDVAQAIADRLKSGSDNLLSPEWINSVWSKVTWNGTSAPEWNAAA